MKWDGTRIRELERSSIREFLESCPELVGRRVLDVGSGMEPYRDLVEGMGSEYDPYDQPYFPGSTVKESHSTRPATEAYGAVLCTQVIQYVPYPAEFLDLVATYLEPGGHLVITYPTCWDEVEAEDLFRYTKCGMGRLLTAGGWTLIRNEHRAHVPVGNFKFWLGGGAVAVRPS